MKQLILIICLIFSQFAAMAQLMIPLFEDPQKVEILSDGAEEGIPLTYGNAEVLYFNRIYQRLGENNEVVTQQDVWMSERKKDKWTRPYRMFRDVDSRQINLIVGCSKDGNRIYLLNRTASEIDGENRDTIVSRITFRERDGKNKWQEAVVLDIPGLNVDDPQATIFMHPSGDVLLMSRVKEGSANNEDLYVYYKMPNGKWSSETHLGDRINTGRLEFSPFLSSDKKALYFASDGHKGFGASDIFVAYREGNSWTDWSRPLNLGLPINSSNFESDFIISDSAHVYFVSDRAGKTADIFHTQATGEYKMANLPILAGRLIKDGQPLSGVQLAAYTTSDKFIEFVKTDGEGKFTFAELSPEDNMKIKPDSAVDTDLSGSKLYLLDGEGNFQRRIVFNGSSEYVDDGQIENRDLIQGFFTKGGSPLLNTALIIQDENGYPIDTIYTNDQGKFEYEKLAMDTDIIIIPRDIEGDDLDGTELYLVDENGARTKTFLGKSSETGKGVFVYQGLPFGNTIIKVMDENGDVVETLVLNSEGKFNYKALDMDKSSSFTLEAENGAELIDGILYLKDADGKTKRYVVQTGNRAVDMASEGSTRLFGQYEYNKLPAANTAIVVMDENGIPLDTLYTDELGRFSYDKLNLDQSVYFQPLGEEDSDLQGLLFMTNESGDIKEELELGKNGYSTKKAKKPELAEKTPIKKKPNLEVKAVFYYFEFNQTQLSNSEKTGLDGLLKTGKLRADSQIELIGHTDDQGSEEVNQQVGLARAKAVRAALIQMGISPSGIQVSSKGETEPQSDNSTEQGRKANRRVELRIK